MLILSRRAGDRVLIGSNIEVVVSEVIGGRVLLGFEAPRETSILRGELTDRPEYRPFREPGGEDLGEAA